MRVSSLAWQEDRRNSFVLRNCRSTRFASNSSSNVAFYPSFLIRAYSIRDVLFSFATLLSLFSLLVSSSLYKSKDEPHALRVPPCSPRLSFLFSFDLSFPLSLSRSLARLSFASNAIQHGAVRYDVAPVSSPSFSTPLQRALFTRFRVSKSCIANFQGEK